MKHSKILRSIDNPSSKFVAETLTLETDEKSNLWLTAEFKDKTKLEAVLTWREVLKIFFLLSELWVNSDDTRLMMVSRFRNSKLDHLTFHFSHLGQIDGQKQFYRISVEFKEFENAIKALA